MRQYITKHKEVFVLALAVTVAMFFQYLRLANLDIAFLFETNAPTLTVYLIVLLSIPLVVLFFVFVPLLFIVEITTQIPLPQKLHIEITEVVYSIKTTIRNYSTFSKRKDVLRC